MRFCLPRVRAQSRFVQVGGVGDVTAIAILAGLPEIGKLPDAKLNRLVGIVPEEKQSGTKEWQRKIWNWSGSDPIDRELLITSRRFCDG